MTKALFDAARGETVSPPPIWLMRQAGRYLPEYREVRATVSGFLELCYTPEKATEVTLQPLRRFDLDAAILFSDILVVPDALGADVRFVENEGPKLTPIRTAAEVDRLNETRVHEHLAPVYETLGRIKAELVPEKTLIGFAGAPWTLACYMVEGGGSKDFAQTRLMALREPEAFAALMGKLERAIAAYLIRQIDSGADVVKLFDSWAGALSADSFARWCIEPLARIVAEVRSARPQTPIIVFPKGAGVRYAEAAGAIGADVVAIDPPTPMAWAAANIPANVVLQGNLDPMALVAGGELMNRAIDTILDAASSRQLIFNLGHGVVPQTNPEHVAQLIARVKQPRT